jgi:hypothetical protein
MARKLRRKDLPPVLNAAGFPISASTLAKLCSPAINAGPPISYWWGRYPIYDDEEALEWARARTSATKKRLAGVNW